MSAAEMSTAEMSAAEMSRDEMIHRAETAAGTAAGTEPKRICKKCLLREMADSGGVDLDKYLGAIKAADRADDSLYEERLSVCRGCELLIAATCQACGCYVELRAALAGGRCPKKKW